ncbi:hypothetical protein [Lysobacter antibioticus]|uniref:hypothetical protein n=1 Tax=Lysobacter antibioticus TaxID=84531 RepID=UPI0007174D52|nr:hypothetical protein [Lysobacter antibioticus]
MPKLDSHLLAKRLVSMVCVLAAFACAATTTGPASVQEKAAMTESASPAINDSLSAQQLNDRILAWILSVNDARDLSGPNVEKRTGLDLGIKPETPNIFRGVGALPEGWRYSLSSVNNTPEQRLRAVLFKMGRAGDRYADMTPVCVGLEHYQSPLIATGFRMTEMPPRAGTEYRIFRNKMIYVRVELHGKTTPIDPNLCVYRVFVTAAAPQG